MARGLPRTTRRWWAWVGGEAVTAIAVVAMVVAVNGVPEFMLESDPEAEGALPSDVEYGIGDWTPRGSLAGDAGFIRDAAAELLDEADKRYYFVWAGHAGDGPMREFDFAVFLSEIENSSVMHVNVARQDSDGHWSVLKDKAEVGSPRNPIIPLPLDDVEGFGDTDKSDFYLLRDDVPTTGVKALEGNSLTVREGVLGTAEEDFEEETPASFEVQTLRGDVFTSPALFRPLRNDMWTASQASRVLAQIPHRASHDGPKLADDSALAELRDPEPMDFEGETGFVVRTMDHNVRQWEEVDPPNPFLQQFGLIVAEPGQDVVVAGPPQDGRGKKYLPEIEAGFAVAAPEGLSTGPAVVVSGGTVSVEPDLPVVATAVEPGGPTIFGDAPESTAVIWHDQEQDPVRTAVVYQTPESERD